MEKLNAKSRYLWPKKLCDPSGIYKQHGILDDETYPIIVTKLPKEDILKQNAIPLFSYKEYGHRIVGFSGSGYHFRVFVSSHREPSDVSSVKVKKDGNMSLRHTPSHELKIYRLATPSIIEILTKYNIPHPKSITTTRGDGL